MIAYFLASAYFSRKMIRLVLLLSPAASVCAGLALRHILEWSWANLGAGNAAAAAAAATATATEDSAAAGLLSPLNVYNLFPFSFPPIWSVENGDGKKNISSNFSPPTSRQ
jgi:hypothetical protein